MSDINHQQSEIDRLMVFYDAHDMNDLVLKQASHIERLQEKLNKLTPEPPIRLNPPREG